MPDQQMGDSPITQPRLRYAPSVSQNVYEAELQEIRASRQRRGVDHAPIDDWFDGKDPSAGSMHLTGLALSGGGIRSASVCLGVLQAFAKHNQLRLFDYMSTVSGGGYIGCSWSALLTSGRQGTATPDFAFFPPPPIQPPNAAPDPGATGSGSQAAPDPEQPTVPATGAETPALARLRNFANYLVPRGLVDELRVPALLLRGVVVNLLIILPYIAIGALLTTWMYWSNEKPQFPQSHAFVATGAVLLVEIVGLLIVTASQSLLDRHGWGSWKERDHLLSLGAFGFLLLLAVTWLDLQAVAVPLLSWLKSTNWAAYLGGEHGLSIISGAAGILSAMLAGRASTTASPTLRWLAFTALGVLGPLALWFIYAELCIWLAAELSHQIATLVLVSISFVLTYWLVDINVTSLHNYYRDKLSNAFIMKLEKGKPVHDDGIRLSQTAPSATGGPYHLINTTANNPRMGEQEQRGRRAEAFLLSPLFCGNERLGYCKTTELEKIDSHIGLATAMAISGAAATPNAGRQTLKPLAVFTLAMLNVRLGYWCRTPGSINKPPRGMLTVGPVYFVLELIGLPHKLPVPFVNLSDGGHLDNLGLLELIRRRCRYIVVIDAEADPAMTFNGLAVAQRFALIDLGVRIDIDLTDIRRDATGFSRRHWALGRIDYGNGELGEILYIKSSVTGTEPQYVAEYQAGHPTFPHETTGDQFFEEAQFEAYRALGWKIGDTLLESRYARAHQETAGALDKQERGARDRGTAAELFSGFRDWLRPAAPFSEMFIELQHQRQEVEKKLRRPEFAAYAAELYPELKFRLTLGANSADTPEPALLQVVNEQMQLIERVVLALRLDEIANQMHARNRGWMNLFRRWSQTATFRRYWAPSIPDYSDGLQNFCRHVLGLRVELKWREADETSFTPTERNSMAQVMRGFHDAGKVRWLQAFAWAQPGREMGDGEHVDGPGFPIALAAIDDDHGGPVLRAFRLRDTYRSMRLGEVLLERLKDSLVPDGDGPAPRYLLKGVDNEAAERLERLLYRLGYQRVHGPRQATDLHHQQAPASAAAMKGTTALVSAQSTS